LIRAVCFDLDDTLLDCSGAARAAFFDALGPGADFALWLSIAETHYARFSRGEVGFARMHLERMTQFLRLSGQPGDPAELEQRRAARLVERYAIFPDARPCLDTLRSAGLALGVITNGDAAEQRRKLATVGLADRFDAVVISGEVGAAKPDAAIFAHACGLLGARPDEALHVGDRLDLDARAAAAAGLTGVWLDRRGLAAGDEPVAVVSTLAELPAVVAAS